MEFNKLSYRVVTTPRQCFGVTSSLCVASAADYVTYFLISGITNGKCFLKVEFQMITFYYVRHFLVVR